MLGRKMDHDDEAQDCLMLLHKAVILPIKREILLNMKLFIQVHYHMSL